ncbi:MAG: hypothetical protein KC477_17485 [Oceanospirillaceae bacterium]|nr:hypothetical protein [Oceanospirillaceae bacterium]
MVPVKIEENLVASGCKRCDGALLSLVTYRNWAEQHRIQHDEVVVSGDVQTDENGKALVCPKCSRLMTKFRIGVDIENRVDLCGSCDEAWLDSGEWTLLKQLELQDKLPGIFTEEWQRRARLKHTQGVFKTEYEGTFGSDYSQIKEIRTWIVEHPKKAEILRYLSNADPYRADR